MVIPPKNGKLSDVLLSSLTNSNVSLRRKTMEKTRSWAHSLAHNTLGVEGMLEPQDGTRKNDKQSFTHTNLHKTKQQVG